MVDEPTLLLYLPAMLAITLAPGADTLFVVGAALRSGVRGGMLGALGVICGGVVHIGAATLGLSALILKSALAFTILKYAGAAYLIYLGVSALRSGASSEPGDDGASMHASPLTLFARGFITNVTNPKVALFVLAFLPQFVSPARGAVWSQFVELGALWYLAGLLWLGGIGIAVGVAKRKATPSRRVRAFFRYATASIFIGLGIRVALTDR